MFLTLLLSAGLLAYNSSISFPLFTWLLLMSLLSLLWSNYHLLRSLLSLELLTLSLFFLLILQMSQIAYPSVLVFIFLVLAVGEASVGLSILIKTARQCGSDLMSSSLKLNKLKAFKVFNAPD